MKKYLQFHRLVALLVVAVPLAIAGCGGGSSTTPEPMPEPTAVERAMSQYDMAKAAYDGLADSATVDQRLAAARALDTAADALVAAARTSGTGAELLAAQNAASASQALLDSAIAAKAAADMAADEAAKTAAAQSAYDSAKSTYDALPAHATNAQRLAAATALRDAAQALEIRLTEAGAAQEAIDQATTNVMSAQMMVDAAQGLIDLATANTEARTAYDAAKMAYDGLTDDATLDDRIAAAKALDKAAKALVAAIAANPGSSSMELASAQEMASAAASALMMAQDAKAEADRMAAAAATLAGLRSAHMTAMAAYGALPDDATDEEKLAAAKALKDAADAVVAELMKQDAPTSEVDAARMAASDAQTKVNTYQAKVNAANEHIRTQMAAITTAQTALTMALGEIDADEPTAEQITAADTARMGLQAAVDGGADLTDAQKSAANAALMSSDVTIAKAQLMMYTAAASADGATDEAKLAAYEGKLMAATRLLAAVAASPDDREEASRIIGSATTMIASLKADIQAAKDAEANAKRLASNAVSMQVAKAINAHKLRGEARTGTALPHAFMDHTDPTGVVAVAGTNDTRWQVTRFSGNAKIRLNQAVDVAADDKYASAPVASASSWYAGWGYSRDSMSGRRPVEEKAAVFTDIEKADDLAWEEYFGDDADNATGLVTLSGRTGDDPPITVERVSSGVLPRAPEGSDPSESRTIAESTKTTATVIRGTFYGVPGVYTCTGGQTCTVARDRDGVLTFANLTFTPTLSATDTLIGDDATVKAKYADPDTSFTHFGYWMKSTTLRDGTKTHMIETLHGGMGGLSQVTSDGTGANLTDVEGTADYYGVAAGVYVKKDDAGDSLVVTDGTFTADAMLTAKFGGRGIAEADHFTVTGTISDFMDGSTDLGFADLALNKASIGRVTADATGDQPATTVGLTSGGETDGGGTSGNWIGQFYGNLGFDTPADTALPNGRPGDSDDFPTDVAGEFNGHFENGHVVGAFGAAYDQ